MKKRFRSRLLHQARDSISYLRKCVLGGSLYRVSDIRGDSSLADIKTQIDTMRALAADSQISTALSYYATDATTMNTAGQIIWATANESSHQEVADIINMLFKRWNINTYARDHILELATIGNLYIPTSDFYKTSAEGYNNHDKVALDNNTILNPDFDIIPSTKIPPEDIIHLWLQGRPQGFVYKPEDQTADYTIFPESAAIHFSLGGLLGNYTINGRDSQGEQVEYDIQFAQPLMDKAVQPTRTLSLLEDALILSSLSRIVKFVNVDCGNTDEETEIQDSLQQIKDAIEQQLSLNTVSGDAQSFVNPQSPNNLIYLPKVNGQDPISITDLNMAEANEQDAKLLQYYQDKKLSVLGVPKEAMNFSSNEGLGGAGSVLSQRSALYANSLQRLENSYISGWTDAINMYFKQRNLSGYVDTFTLHMTPIVTQLSTITFDKRDSAIGQASSLVDLLKDIGVSETDTYLKALTEILSEVLPQTGADALGWKIDVDDGGDNV